MRLLAILLAASVLGGCSSIQNVFHRGSSNEPITDVVVDDSEENSEERGPVVAEDPHFRLEEALRKELDAWYGTPHVMGGMSRQGVDCSGLIHVVYADVLAVDTPRTTSGMIKEGSRIRRSKLQTGDLVFFEPEKKSDHVGIYLSNGEFAHTSSSRGVMVSNLSNPYWDRYYLTSRRILDDERLARVIQTIEQRQTQAADLQAGGR